MRPGVSTILRKQLPHDAGTRSRDHGSGAHERSICGCTYTYMYVHVYTHIIVHAYMYMACATPVAHACACMHMFVVRSMVEDLHMHNLCNIMWHKIFRIYNCPNIGPIIIILLYPNHRDMLP